MIIKTQLLLRFMIKYTKTHQMQKILKIKNLLLVDLKLDKLIKNKGYNRILLRRNHLMILEQTKLTLTLTKNYLPEDLKKIKDDIQLIQEKMKEKQNLLKKQMKIAQQSDVMKCAYYIKCKLLRDRQDKIFVRAIGQAKETMLLVIEQFERECKLQDYELIKDVFQLELQGRVIYQVILEIQDEKNKRFRDKKWMSQLFNFADEKNSLTSKTNNLNNNFALDFTKSKNQFSLQKPIDFYQLTDSQKYQSPLTKNIIDDDTFFDENDELYIEEQRLIEEQIRLTKQQCQIDYLSSSNRSLNSMIDNLSLERSLIPLNFNETRSNISIQAQSKKIYQKQSTDIWIEQSIESSDVENIILGNKLLDENQIRFIISDHSGKVKFDEGVKEYLKKYPNDFQTPETEEQLNNNKYKMGNGQVVVVKTIKFREKQHD
ncbi:UNKNOWN [Stylonychia lemnae]|uniref:Uncharacterized protein n=1 Tax=Stylonychia lemnae TaxID=5949 RepID=A0A078B369_STYLE|nr:UNKNOWN [Stylonychia lemnae]|eukprot:CDW87938.1 UNKNOWN [Stylonychia lemnae]